MVKIAPSLMCVDLLNLGQQIKVLDELGVHWYHIDIMDGNYVPNFGFGPDMIRAVRSATTTPLMVHMMCEKPENHIGLISKAGADCLAVHIDTLKHPIRVLQMIRESGMKAGIVLNPATSLESLNILKEYVDFITVMSFDPGFAGLKFNEFTYEKIKSIRQILGPEKRSIPIEVDGGINPENSTKSLEAGADILVAGYFSVFIKGKPIEENYHNFVNSL